MSDHPDRIAAAKRQFNLLGFGDDLSDFTDEQAIAYLDWSDSKQGARTDVIPMDQELNFIATLLGKRSTKFTEVTNGND